MSWSSHTSVSFSLPGAESGTSGEGASQPGTPASGSATIERDAARDGSEEREEGPAFQGSGKRIVLRLRGYAGYMGPQVLKKGRYSAPGEGSSALQAAPIDPKPPHPRFPESGTSEDVIKWSEEWRKIGDLAAEDPHSSILTLRAPKDPDTTDAVQTKKYRMMVVGVAQSVVSVSSIGHDGEKIGQYSGIIIKQLGEDSRAIIVTCSKIVCRMGKLLNPVPKISVGLPDADQTFLEGLLLFYNDHYDLALVEIRCPWYHIRLPSIGSSPTYGQPVFVLGRDEELSVMARRGQIMWEEEANYVGRNHYMFLNCEVPEGAAGGPVVGYDGCITAMAFHCSPNPAILSISTIITCINMWLNFGRIVRPLHGLGLRTVGMLDVETLDAFRRLYHGVQEGYIVETVAYDLAAEKLGIEAGNVILSLDGDVLDLPKLEDYLLSLGWAFLNDSSTNAELKLFVANSNKRCNVIHLPLVFCAESDTVSGAVMTSQVAAPNPAN
ncbi:unnamed protein product [Urochloa humidicola]